MDDDDVNPTFDSTTINDNGSYNMIEGNNGWKPQLVSNPDPLQTYDLDIQVPQTTNPLETITNKRLQSEITYTISSLMSDPTNNAGITKNSTVIVDVPEHVYPEITFNTITNNNTTYTLSQLTNNQSEYFSKNSTITTNIPTSITIPKLKYVCIGTSESSLGTKYVKTDFTFNSSNKSVTILSRTACITFSIGIDNIQFRFTRNQTNSSITMTILGNEYYLNNISAIETVSLYLLDENENILNRLIDWVSSDAYPAACSFYNTLLDYSEFI